MARQRPALDVVAACYTAAAQEGAPPTMAVRDRFGVAKSTAEGWICQARSAGLLSAVGQGAGTARNRKALAVATTLGLGYGALITVVREHADGNLRVGSHGRTACHDGPCVPRRTPCSAT